MKQNCLILKPFIFVVLGLFCVTLIVKSSYASKNEIGDIDTDGNVLSDNQQ